MIITTTAMVLRIVPFSETSQVVTWLTPGQGKIVTMIKGALRRDSMFQGQYDLFCQSELLFYARWQSALHIARECCMLKPRLHLRRNWKAAACASYLADLINNWLPAHAPHPAGFALLDDALDALDQPDAPDALVPWFELRLLELAGVGPGLRVCQGCRIPLFNSTAVAPRACFFTPAHGGVLCPDCQAARAPADSVRVAPDVLAVMGFWQVAAAWEVARRMRCNPRQRLALLELLGVFLDRHLEVPGRARRIMLEINGLAAGADGV